MQKKGIAKREKKALLSAICECELTPSIYVMQITCNAPFAILAG